MDKSRVRQVIADSIGNIERLYQDVGTIMQVIEEKMLGGGFKALGDTGVIWQSSASLKAPELWLSRYMTRIYHKEEKQISRLVGYNIHLTGDYTSTLGWASLPSDWPIPLVAVSLLKFNTPLNLKVVPRTALLDTVWGAGWYPDIEYKKVGTIRLGTDCDTIATDTATFFIDMLDLSDGSEVERLVVEPMRQMYAGDEQYVNDQSLPVVP